MDSKFVDTNVFIEIFVRFGDKSNKCKKLISSGQNLSTNIVVFSEIEWVLRSFYEMEKSLVVKCLKIVLSSNIDMENRKAVIDSLIFYEKNNVDWTDSLNMFLVKSLNISKVYSYDKGLNKFDWIKRLEP